MGIAGGDAHSFNDSIDKSTAEPAPAAAMPLLVLRHLGDVGVELHALLGGEDRTDRRVLLRARASIFSRCARINRLAVAVSPF